MTKTVIAVVDDLFFASKIRATAEQLGITVKFARSVEGMLEATRRDRPRLIICDLYSQKIDPFALAGRLKADEHLRSVVLMGFFSHVDTELRERAEQAGFDQVLPRSAFAKNLPDILAGASDQ